MGGSGGYYYVDPKVEAQINDAALLAQGPPGPGYVFQPTIFAGARGQAGQSGGEKLVTGQWVIPNKGGGGWLDSFLGNPLGTIANTVTDFVKDPAKSTTQFFENPGVKEAAVLAALYAGLPGLEAGAAGTAGAGAAGADALLASELAAYPTAGIVGSGAAGAGLTSLAPEILTAGSAPGALAATLPAYVAPTAAELVAAGTTAGGTLTTGLGNEAVASGTFTPGSVGSVANAAGVLTPTQVAAAAGLPGLTSLTGADAAAAKLAASGNEAVASGMSPGSVGAAQAAAGMLTPEQLAAAYGVNSALDGLKVPRPFDNSNGADLMKQGLSLINNTTNVGGNSSQALQSTGLSSLAPNSQSNLLKELVQLYPQMSNVNPQTMAAISPYYRMQEIPQTHMPAEEPQSYAKGGLSRHRPEFITGATGHYVKGRGDGQSDDIPAMLADGEYVFDADTVASLGNGSSDAGAKRLDKMREAIRKHKRSAPIHKIPPKAKSPLEYLKG